MKKHILSISVLILLSVFVLVSCKKKKNDIETAPVTETPNPTAVETGQDAIDYENSSIEVDAALSDINQVTCDYVELHGKINQNNNINGILGTICGMVLDTNGLYMGTMKLNYNGTTCNNRNKTGAIKISIQNYGGGDRWKNINCLLKIEYFNYKSVNIVTNKSVEFNGTAYLKNISGGTWFDLIFLSQTSLTQSITASQLNVKVNNLNTMSSNINRNIGYTYASTEINSYSSGGAIFNGYNYVENYGTNIHGDSVIVRTSSYSAWRTGCGTWAPVQGGLEIHNKNKAYNINVTFGVDVNGILVIPSPTVCPFGYKIDWTIGSTSSAKTLGYL